MWYKIRKDSKRKQILTNVFPSPSFKLTLYICQCTDNRLKNCIFAASFELIYDKDMTFIQRITLLLCLATLAGHCSAEAQNPIMGQRYPNIPDEFQEVYNDYIEDHKTSIINTENGQFLGQTRDGLLYGYGVYIANDGSQWIGQYRKGECIFGILISGTSATVGSKNHYVYYDLTTRRIKFIRESGNDRIVPENDSEGLHFEALNYSNGDRYVGETLNGNKHGYGIYYWANGNYWYGQYSNNMRYGYGALFLTSGEVIFGRWLGDEMMRR